MDQGANWLLSHRLRGLADDVAAAADDTAAEPIWAAMEEAIQETDAAQDEDLALAVMLRSLPDLRARIQAWDRGEVALPEWDKAVLKRAMNAFRKRLKLTRLDDEASSSRNPLSKGAQSSICGVRPPELYPPEVWETLVRLGRLREGTGGRLESV